MRVIRKWDSRGSFSFFSVVTRAPFLCALSSVGRMAVEGGVRLLLAHLGYLGGYVDRNPLSYLCILDILCSSMSSLPRNPLAKGLFSIFNWVI